MIFFYVLEKQWLEYGYYSLFSDAKCVAKMQTKTVICSFRISMAMQRCATKEKNNDIITSGVHFFLPTADNSITSCVGD